MNSTNSRRKKSPSSKARKVGRVTPGAPPPANPRVRAHRNGAQGLTRPTSLRQEFRAWRDSLPTALERDTLLMPDAIAESVVQEVERFLAARVPDDFDAKQRLTGDCLWP